MRDKINNSPTAQIALIAILLVVGAFLVLTGMGGGEEAATAPAPGAAAPADPAAAAAASTAAVGASPTAPTAATAPAVPAPPMPAPVRRAYESGKTVVLLIHGEGIDDRLVADTVQRLASIPALAVFVVPVKQIARYGAITLGVQVDRVPALVVMRPRELSDGTPQASVSYGFQSPKSVLQAVLDASYDGPASTYQPN